MTEPAALALAEAWLELPDGRLHWLGRRCTIGRHPDNELVLDGPSLSRRHAMLSPDSGGYLVSDLHSRNGTYLNGVPVTNPVAVRDADELRFGDVVVRFRCTRQLGGPDTAAGIAATIRLDQVSERRCCLLLLDVIGFTALNESLGSEAALRRIQAWISEVRPLIEGHGGRINGYLGDAIFAYWFEDAATCPGALASLRAIEVWRPRSPLAFRLVMHHGAVLFTRSDRGEELSGQDVNLLFRSEKLAKKFAAPAMLSGAAVQSLSLQDHCVLLGHSPIDGMSGEFEFYAPSAPSLSAPGR